MLAAWVLFCMVMGASYTGNLKAYLTTPSFTEPIDSLEQIDASGYELEIIAGGEEEAVMMETSTDPLMMRIWSKMNILEFEAVPDVCHKTIFLKMPLNFACF